MIIKTVTDRSFKPFGNVVKGYDVNEIMQVMETLECPTDAVVYHPSVPELEQLTIFQKLQAKAYGGMPIQLGFCNGVNHKLNALEYHRDSEFNIACTDLILLVGRQQDVVRRGFRYNTARVKAFFVPKGTMIEVYATTLHYAPISADGKQFRCVVVLPKGTNEPLPKRRGKAPNKEDMLLTHVNKWLIAHADSGLGETGAHIGLTGDNITIE